jgi:hypothetical protein
MSYSEQQAKHKKAHTRKELQPTCYSQKTKHIEHKFICITGVQFLDKYHILKYGLFEGKNWEWEKKPKIYLRE